MDSQGDHRDIQKDSGSHPVDYILHAGLFNLLFNAHSHHYSRQPLKRQIKIAAVDVDL